MKTAINGFGRIGRAFFRIAFDAPDVEVVSVNDVGDAPTLAHLLKYDSVYGVWNKKVEAANGSLVVDGKRIPILTEKEPAKLPWKTHGVDIVLEATGKFRTKDDAKAHLDAGARKVLISAPGKSDLDGDFILGVNDDEYDAGRHHIISIGSCTTNCLAPVAKVLHEEFTIQRGLMTTVHAYTSSQQLVDGPHKDLRRARAAAANIIPTTTGAAKAVALVIPDLKGKFDGYSLRVPTPTVSVVDFTAEIEKEITTDELRQAFREAAQEPRLRGILEAVDEPLVSMDFKGSSYSSSVDLPFTSVLGKDKSNFIKVVTWYDNEWGYSVRTADLANLIAGKL